MDIRILRIFRVFPLLLLLAAFGAGPSESENPKPAQYFQTQLEDLVPALLKDGPPGMAIALIEDGQVVYQKGFGWADKETGVKVTPETVFNIGSISKTLTAWGVMQLVEEGKIDLDAPIEAYLPGLLESDEFDPGGITIRRLLSHTAGLSVSAVPEYGPGEELPTLETALDDVEIIAPGGEGWAYSGGGYMVLQALIEEVSGQPFAAFMKENVLDPLGMKDSSFVWEQEMLAKAATGYDGEQPAPNFRYVGKAAASLNASLQDLALFIAANTSPETIEIILKPETLSLMQTPVENAVQRFGQKYGLGYDIWGLATGDPLVGHNGQNTGWGAAAWAAPDLGDGIIILTNRSDGYDSYKWVLCDWVKWKADTTWYGMCTNRPEDLPGAPNYEQNREISKAIDDMFKAYTGEGSPGASVLVTKKGKVIHEGNYGLAEIETGRSITSDTAFYLASVSKSFTAQAILSLVAEGKLGLDQKIGDYFPGLWFEAENITVEKLLTHTSGLPDYYRFVQFGPDFKGLDNEGVLKILNDNLGLDFEPGEKYSYSNSGYVLLSLLVERISGQSLEGFLREHIFDPLQMETTSVYDDLDETLPPRAFGYRPDEATFTPFDYVSLRLGDGSLRPVGFTTTGAGGIYSTTSDLLKWVNSLDFSLPMFSPAMVTGGDEGIPGTTHYGYGWLVGEFAGEKMLWHDGSMVGFSNIVFILPDQGISIIILSNVSGTETRKMASEIARLFF